jgi:hypothetical protein
LIIKKEEMKEKKITNFQKTFLNLTLIIFSFSFIVLSCEKYQYSTPTVDPDEDVSFKDDILTFIEDQNCAACHPAASPPDLTEGNVYESLMDGYVDTANPEQSKIYTQFEGGHVGYNTSSVEILKILNWIKQGAENN